MKQPDHTFTLIKSLSQNEKRYFRVFATSTGTDKNYMKVFNALDKAKQFDAKKISRNLKDINFSYEKNYLQKQLLRSLRSFHAEGNVENLLKQKLVDINNLYEKKQYSLCLFEIEKHIPVAEEFEKFSMLYEFLRWRRIVADESLRLDISRQYIETGIAKEKVILEKLVNLQQYEALFNRFFFFTKTKGTSGDEKKTRGLEKLMGDKLLRSERNALSLRSKNYFHSIHATYYLLKGNMELSFKHSFALVKNAGRSSSLIKEDPKIYFAALNNFIARCMLLDKQELFDEYLAKFRELPTLLSGDKKKYYEVRVFNNSSQLELEYFIRKGNYKVASALVEKVIPKVSQFEKELTTENKSILFFSIANVFFGAGQFKNALIWFNRMINVPDVREDLQRTARLIKFLIYYEQKDKHGMELAEREYAKFILKRSSSSKFETACVNFFNDLVKEKNKPKEVIKKMKERVDTLIEHDPSINDHFKFTAWLHSKVERISFTAAAKKI